MDAQFFKNEWILNLCQDSPRLRQGVTNNNCQFLKMVHVPQTMAG